MLITIDPGRRGLMYQEEMKWSEAAKSWALPVITEITEHWMKELGSKTLVLLAIVRATLQAGRGAEAITTRQLVEATGMSERSIQGGVESLCSDEFLNVFVVKTATRKAEAVTRIYEIDFKKLFSRGMTPAEFAGGAHIYIHRYFVPSYLSVGLDKSNLLSPASPSSPVGQLTTVGEVEMLAVPKRPRKVVATSNSILEVLAKTKSAATQSRGVLASAAVAAPARDLNAKALQALLDQTMKTYLPSAIRMIVTAKAMSVFKRRVSDAGISDLGGFVKYVVMYWGQLSEQNRAVYIKDPSRKGEPLPAAPNFSTLAYKLPYFIKAFSNHAAGMQMGREDKGEANARIARLEKALRESQAANHQLLRTRHAPRPITIPQPVRLARGVSTPRAAPADLDGDWSIPEWTSNQPRQKKA